METIQHLVHQRLTKHNDLESMADHPDEDSICAFIDGRLDESGSSQMVSHLVACGTCRRITAEVTRMDFQISIGDKSSPARLRSILDGLASRILSVPQEDVVFAYQDPLKEDAANQDSEPTRRGSEASNKKVDHSSE